MGIQPDHIPISLKYKHTPLVTPQWAVEVTGVPREPPQEEHPTCTRKGPGLELKPEHSC